MMTARRQKRKSSGSACSQRQSTTTKAGPKMAPRSHGRKCKNQTTDYCSNSCYYHYCTLGKRYNLRGDPAESIPSKREATSPPPSPPLLRHALGIEKGNGRANSGGGGGGRSSNSGDEREKREKREDHQKLAGTTSIISDHAFRSRVYNTRMGGFSVITAIPQE